jgi:hypothetical protein
MKLTISAATVMSLNTDGATLASIILGSHKVNTGYVLPPEVSTEYVNQSVTIVDGNYVYEVNDEAMLKVMALYIKVARIVAPFIHATIALLGTLGDDVKEIDRFLSLRK